MSKFYALHDRFISIFEGHSVAYTDKEKNDFHKEGLKLLKSLAKHCGIEADFRSNKGGIAVSGEITMHGDTVYVQLSQRAFEGGAISFLVRQCEGRKDYCGKTNHYHHACDPNYGLANLVNRLK